ncbi:MAG: Sjogren's syndrome/scleroderma autoantigen 1 family protein [Candidatus Heimdallarchaeota archaeon]
MTGNKKDEEEKGIKAISEALRAGGTLLNAACPICSFPLIKVKEKIYCKICDNEVIIYKDASELPKEYQQALKHNNRSNEIKDSPIIKTLKNKIEGLRNKLEAAEDPDEIIKISDAIDKLLNTLKNAQAG